MKFYKEMRRKEDGRKFYLDFGIKRVVCVEENDRVIFLPPSKLRLRKGDQVYLEFGGHSDAWIRKVLSQGVIVYQIYGGYVKEQREKLGWPKNDIMDAKVIKILAQTSPRLFHLAQLPSIEMLKLNELVKALKKIISVLDSLVNTKQSKTMLGEDPVSQIWQEVFQAGEDLGYKIDSQAWKKWIEDKIIELTVELPLFRKVFEPLVGRERVFECALIINWIKDIRRYPTESVLTARARFQITREGHRVTSKTKIGGSKFLHGLFLRLADNVVSNYKENVTHPIWRDRVKRVWERQFSKTNNSRIAFLNTRNTIARMIIRAVYREWKKMLEGQPKTSPA